MAVMEVFVYGDDGMDDMERFGKVLAELDAVNEEASSEVERLRAGCEEALRAMYKEVHPRREFTVARCLEEVPKAEEVRLEWQERAVEVMDGAKVARKELKDELVLLAGRMDVPVCDEWAVWTTVSSTFYNSQGFGACKYARQSAQQYADKAMFHGVEAEVVEMNRHRSKGQWPVDHADYEVRVKTTEVGMAILDRKPDIPMDEWVRLCWERGVNPRVYNPFLPSFLPSSYEEEHGLDYFGNRIGHEDQEAEQEG